MASLQFFRVIPEIDICRDANLILKLYGIAGAAWVNPP
jgi:hypothetical protein